MKEENYQKFYSKTDFSNVCQARNHNSEGLTYYDFLEDHRVIHRQYYSAVLEHKVRPAIKRK